MALTPGTRVGPYEVLNALGAGGMGEVYRARDTRLRRDVALKVLPDSLAGDSERMARFQREAELLAALNHPNIATVYGVEGQALVMELVEGESPQGPMSLEEAWKIASQIAAALEYAHDRGIIHRDLKPANVKVTPDGTVKLLDFGLAKAFSGQQAISGNPENSPTLTLGATQMGVVLGTAAYMAPEQAKGKTVDKRADIWSFGVTLYELLTGERLFAGEDVPDTLVQVLSKPPDWNRVPAPARRLLRECLERDPKQRLRDIGDAQRLIGAEPAAAAAPRMARWYWPAAAGALAIALTGVSLLSLRNGPPPEVPVHLSVALPENASVRSLALSPDGSKLVVAATIGSEYHLWVRPLNSPDLQPLAGTDEARVPFWSPDSRSIGFFAAGKLKTIPATGGPAQVLCEAGLGLGGTWNRDGVILFSSSVSRAIYRVQAAGGPCTAITKPGGNRQFPEFLPDGRHFFYVVSGEESSAGVYVGSLDEPNGRRVLGDVSSVAYAPPAGGRKHGYLLFRRDDFLIAQEFDAVALRTIGDVFRVAGHASSSNTAPQMAAAVAANGTLAYLVNGDSSVRNLQLTWFDRAGKELGKIGTPARVLGLSLSPDEKTVATTRAGSSVGVSSLWLYDAIRGAESRLTLGVGAVSSPVFSPDGARVVFAGAINGSSVPELYEKAIGGGPEKVILKDGGSKFPSDWSLDGRYMVYTEIDPKTGADIWILPDPSNPSTGRKPVPFLRTPFTESEGKISPDGHWIAYTSDESGRYEVYVRPFPAGEGKWQVSTRGGMEPAWRRDGRELYYLEGLPPRLRVMAVAFAAGARPPVGAPQRLYEFHGNTRLPRANQFTYSPSNDGQRFLLSTASGQEQPSLDVILNWEGDATVPQ